MCEFAFAQKFWEGEGFDSNWSNPNNWFPVGVPIATDNVIFPTGSSNCTADISTTINSMVMQATYTGTITMNSVTITVSGATDNQFLSGTVTGTGTIAITSTKTALFNGADFTINVNINASLTTSSGVFTGGTGTIFGGPVNVTAYSILLNGSRYESQATFNKTGAPGVNSMGAGGNVFKGLTSITNSQNFFLVTGNSAGDIFDGELRLHLQGTSPGNQIHVAYGTGTHTTFNNNIRVSTENTASITNYVGATQTVTNGQIAFGAGPGFGPVSGGTSTLADGYTIDEFLPAFGTPAPLAGEFIFGDLSIRNMTLGILPGNAPHSINLRIPLLLASVSRLRFFIVNCVFNGSVDFTASNAFVTNTTFNSSFIFRKQTGGGSDGGFPYPNALYRANTWDGGNTYNSTASFFSYNNSTWVMGRLNPDTFKGNVTLYSEQSTGHYRIAEGPGYTSFLGNIAISRGNNTNEVTIDFGRGGGTAGFNGGVPQSITFDRPYNDYLLRFGNLDIKNSSGVQFGLPATILGNVNFQQGMLQVPDSLTFRDDATVTGAKDGSFVQGNVYKKGKAPFTFPIGHNAEYHPIGITAPADPASIFLATYTKGNHNFGATSDDNDIEKVSDCEYWNLIRVAGTDNPTATLYWNDASYCHSNYITDPSTLQVVRWSGAVWNNLDVSSYINVPSTDGTEGSLTAGLSLPNATSHILTLGSLSELNILPVTLASFQVFPFRDVAELKWQTASEFNNDYFTIERLQTNAFVPLAKISGVGTTSIPTNYEWTDTDPLPGLSYYRLKQTDFDGKETYSDVVALHRKIDESPYPNPVKNILYLDGLNFDEDSKLIVTDITGRVMYSSEPTQSLNFQEFPSGIYHLGIKDKKGVRWYSIRKE
jgi:hypothetical protein